MAATQFKLSKPGGLTRRATFGEQPSWLALASKIESLYHIPAEKVAVSYLDNDGDEVTLSSHEELLDFYAHTYRRGDAIKFNVIDLSTTRAARGAAIRDDASTSTPAIPPLSANVMFEVDGGQWKHIPHFPDMFSVSERHLGSDAGHAYVEVVESDAHSTHKDTSVSDMLEIPTPVERTAKGKGRAWADGLSSISSTGSVLDDEAPAKLPVHVYDVSDIEVQSPPPRTESTMTPRVAQTAMPLVSSPKQTTAPNEPQSSAPVHSPPPIIRVNSNSSSRTSLFSGRIPPDPSKPLPKTPSTRPASFAPSGSHSKPSETLGPHAAKGQADGAGGAADPPLEATGEGASLNGVPSLTNDVANLLDALRTTFATHPELSEGMRNLISNAASGLYWNMEREGLVSAAGSMRRTASESSDALNRAAEDVRRNAELEASRRVAEALGSVFRVVGEITNSIYHMGAPHLRSTPPPADLAGTSPNVVQPSFVPPPPSFRVPGPAPHRHGAGWPFVGPPGSFPLGGPQSLPKTALPARNPLPNPPQVCPFPSHGAPPGGPFHPPPPQYGMFPPPPPLSGHRGPPGAPPLQGPAVSGTLPSSSPSISQEFQFPWRVERLFGHTPPRRHATWSAGGHSTAVPARGAEIVPLSAAPAELTGAAPYDLAAEESERKLNPHERKAQLEAAKAFYKAEKDKFRQVKEQRRQAKRDAEERKAEEGRGPILSHDMETVVARIPLGIRRNTSARSAPNNSTQVTHAKTASFAEVYSVSPQHQPVRRRVESKPEQGSSSQKTLATLENSKSKVEDRVSARLNDMGFTMSAHPNITTLIRNQVKAGDRVSRDNEDTIVTKILEKLIVEGAQSPRPTGSGIQ